MCYHFSIPDAWDLENRFQAKFTTPKQFHRYYHVSGFTLPLLPVISDEHPKQIQMFQWGLIPFWVKSLDQANKMRARTLNARAETIHEKPSFRHAIMKKRCLIPSDGFYEWHHYRNKKYPHFIRMQPPQTFAFAGIWDKWTNPSTTKELQTFSIITTEANALLAKIHNKRKRMPVILKPSDEQRWLDHKLSRKEIDTFLIPYDPAKMMAHPISRLITTRYQDTNVPEVREPFTYKELTGIP
ncbi:MAG: SOS response-associated peptidase [Candidatus Ranarchaeia archaeon]|jgi:putative SOS response-associated peptidase YedK